MCIICQDLDKLTTLEAVRNLGEMVESVGKDHAKKVLENIAVRETENLNDPNYSLADSLDALKVTLRIMGSITNENEKSDLEELASMADEVEKILNEDPGQLPLD